MAANNNYYYESIDDKYYIPGNKSYDIVKHVDNGYLVTDEYGEYLYVLKFGWQGYYYKDYEAFKSGQGVCYIPEYNYVNDRENYLIISEKDVTDSKYYRKDIVREVRNELSGEEYRDFFNKRVPQKLISQIAMDVFDIIDWQHPESYIYEVNWEEDIKEYFIRHPKDMEKYASEELKKELQREEKTYE